MKSPWRACSRTGELYFHSWLFAIGDDRFIQKNNLEIMNTRKLIKIAFVALLVWNFFIFSAPFLVSSKSSVLQLLGTFFYFFLNPVCHQLPARSIFIYGLPLPVCARCTFIYLGGLAFFTFALFQRSFKSWPAAFYIVSALLVGAEIILEKTNVYHNLLEVRIASGFLLGVILSRLIIEGLCSAKLKKGIKVYNG